MKISVTQEDIAKGHRSDPCECPIALAVARTVGPGEAETVFAQEDEIELWNRGAESNLGWSVWKVEAPPSVRPFIRRFDQGMSVQPFDFDLEIPS